MNEDRLIRASDAKRAIEHADPSFAYVIDNVPTAERTHGQWIVQFDEDDCEYIECALCCEQFYDGDNDTFDKPWNYCPNCGAQMNKE